MKRTLILALLILACLVATTTAYALPPSGQHFAMGNDITLTLVSVERYPSPTLGSNGLIFDVVATYYVSGGADIQLEHSSALLDEAQVLDAAVEPGGASGKLRRVCELIMESDPDFSAEMLGLRKQLEIYVATVTVWLGL